MPNDSVQHVSDTAFWVAHHRFEESNRMDALFRDPLAGKLAGEHGARIAATMPTPRITAWVVVVRTRMIDDFIREALAEGVDTVCNLGAGLDTRPYRMDLPSGLRWVEADFPKVIDFKSERLAKEVPRCRLERVGVDLTDDRARDEFLAGLDASSKKILVLTEGVVIYLTNEQAGGLADSLRKLSHLHGWILDYTSPVWSEMRKKSHLDEKLRSAPFRFRPADWRGFFSQHGFSVREIRFYLAEAEKLGRSFPLAPWWKWLTRIRGLFLSAEQRRALREFGGYALLAPAGS